MAAHQRSHQLSQAGAPCANWSKAALHPHRLDDLKEPFKTSAKEFVDALRTARVTVQINATYRPTERSYLKYYRAAIARGKTA
jgi:hypothetical protein